MSVVGEVYNKWRVVEDLGIIVEHNRRRHFIVAQCECGTQRVCKYYEVKTGRRKSCVTCSNKSRSTHGMFGTPTYSSWSSMIYRTTNPAAKEWDHYGGRGVTVCDRWRDFSLFFADMGERPEGTSLDRIDVNGDYCLENCRWATIQEQNRNKRHTGNFDGKCLSEWSEITGISLPALKYRVINLGMSVTEAIKCGPSRRGMKVCERGVF